jgi:hypothetical protein
MSGLDNWYSINYKPKQKNSDIDFSVAFHLAQPASSLSFRDAADYTARKLKDNYSNLWLAMSGGMDSEVVANALHRNFVPFTPVILKEQTREHWWALRWCEERDITPVIIEPSNVMIAYVMQKAKELDLRLSPWPFLLYLKHYVEQQGGYLITGEADLHYDTEEYHEAHGANNWFEIWNWALYTDIEDPGKHPGSFFMYTPEMMLSIITHSDMTLNTEAAKAKLYNIPFRIKTHGVDLGKTLPEQFHVSGKGTGNRRCTWNQQDLINILC